MPNQPQCSWLVSEVGWCCWLLCNNRLVVLTMFLCLLVVLTMLCTGSKASGSTQEPRADQGHRHNSQMIREIWTRKRGTILRYWYMTRDRDKTDENEKWTRQAFGTSTYIHQIYKSLGRYESTWLPHKTGDPCTQQEMEDQLDLYLVVCPLRTFILHAITFWTFNQDQ